MRSMCDSILLCDSASSVTYTAQLASRACTKQIWLLRTVLPAPGLPITRKTPPRSSPPPRTASNPATPVGTRSIDVVDALASVMARHLPCYLLASLILPALTRRSAAARGPRPSHERPRASARPGPASRPGGSSAGERSLPGSARTFLSCARSSPPARASAPRPPRSRTCAAATGRSARLDPLQKHDGLGPKAVARTTKLFAERRSDGARAAVCALRHCGG